LVRGRRILIVDDDRIGLNLLKEIVGGFGYLVSTASTGHEAIQAGRRHDFDGVLLDLVLPDMNGIEVLEQFRQMHPTIMILIVSGHMEYKASVLAKGANGFLLKPFELNTLKDSMARWFGKA
jgi:CheY-like chemotaxis protein